ncbi:rhomboid family intramembrane serine protease [Haladaptatus sp. DYSN1]|uniref:rhomboid family intramembrane serine protease n=1 Tax=unclassified Haladaptatus TaxID=2622732 RepID=UPI0024061A06|nr:rhomboid family intramembrane serine protease [Haladaptatus sp. DYSN1]
MSSPAHQPARRNNSSLSATFFGNPVVETLVAMTVVTFLTWVSFFTGLGGLFVLAQPLLNPPWALVTSVYAHAGVGHLISNAIIVVLAGSLVAWSTTRLRFHAFFVTTGALAGVAEVLISGLLGQPTAVLGASGAAFALVGYVLAANPASTVLFDRLNLPPRVLVVLVAAAGLVLTFLFSAPGSALIAHLMGAMLGLVAGRMRLLRVPKR